MNIHPIYYDVATLEELLFKLNRRYSAVFVLADAGIPQEARDGFVGNLPAHHVHTVLGGETVKTMAAVEGIWNFLLGVHADRNALLINLGGGAVCDAGGFAASTFKRGIAFVHVPSTLLSMVDASVGGKTGINVGGLKNTVGTFTQPQAVAIHVPLLKSLPVRELLSGYAEMVKHGLVADEPHLQKVLASLWAEGNIPSRQLIRDSIAIKAAIVERDPLEKGERKLLNFGHTVGHGLESCLAGLPDRRILHGEAVAAGMLAEMYISARTTCREGFPKEMRTRVTAALKHLAAPVRIDKTLFAGILEKIENDKKNEGDQIGVTLLAAFGTGVWGTQVTRELVKESLQYLVESGLAAEA